MLQGMETQEENADLVTRVKWLRETVGHHTKLGNKLINVARRLIANARDKIKGSTEEADATNRNTIQAYLDLAQHQATKVELNDQQKQQIRTNWLTHVVLFYLEKQRQYHHECSSRGG